MNYAADNGDDPGNALVFLGLAPFFILFFVWLISAAVAAAIAMERDRSGIGFFLATFFFLGPLGVGVALLATRGEMDRLPPTTPPEPKRNVADGRQGFNCPGAEHRTTCQTRIQVTSAGSAVRFERSSRSCRGRRTR